MSGRREGKNPFFPLPRVSIGTDFVPGYSPVAQCLTQSLAAGRKADLTGTFSPLLACPVQERKDLGLLK